MTTPPAAWYDDPEDPTHHRFWDGTNWTDHRAPKDLVAPPPTELDGSAWNIFPDTFNAIGATWRQLLVLSIPNLAMTVVALIVAWATVDAVFDGELGEIVDRLNDGSRSAADDAYFDGLSATSPGWLLAVAIVVGVVWFVVGSFVATALHATLAASMVGRTLEPAEAFRGAASRLPRVVGWSALLTIVVVVVTMSTIVSPLSLVVTLPCLLLLSPYLLAFYPALTVAPTKPNPLAHARQLVAGRWLRSVRRCLVFALLWFLVTFTGALVTQFFAADLRVAFVGTALSALVQNAVLSAAVVAYWVGAGGPIDSTLTGHGGAAQGT